MIMPPNPVLSRGIPRKVLAGIRLMADIRRQMLSLASAAHGTTPFTYTA